MHSLDRSAYVSYPVGWYKAYGFVPSSGGSLCYYGGSRNLDRELVQFIPRCVSRMKRVLPCWQDADRGAPNSAVVFVVVIYLYARLFRFLRRPDAISLSGSGKDTADLKDVRGQQDCSQESRGAWHKFKGGIRKTFGMTPQAGSLGQTNSVVPPWELLHINIAGLDLDAIPNSVVLPVHEKMLPLSLWSSPPASDERARSVRINTASTLVSSNDGRNNSHDSQPKQQAVIDEKSHESIAVPVLLINRELSPNSLAALDEPPSPFQLDGIGYSGPLSKPEYGGGMTIKNKPSSVTFNPNEDHKEEEDDQRPAEHSLRNFFQANRASESEVRDAHAGDDIRPEESAAAYSNRQASLLMIYFPLSYMAVFSISLVRLMHDMITSKTSVALTTISLWFVLSAGLTDALVYVSLYTHPIRLKLRNLTLLTLLSRALLSM
ncbi:hypothetical protein QFC19_007432 [Naganishia cerealis]|uniref:Uncharacterized protein n=1 Tax=Naganishia cerealis TaxID=610337 RepID=A0ACC2VA14_9TREE|nr:hypothetical protein QFC19_007432 [Naganishia cerealis]